MVRYRDSDDSETGRTLLLTAGVVAGLLAGAVVAQKLGGWRGLRRALRGRGVPALALLKRALPAGTLASILELVHVDELVGTLLGAASPGNGGRRRGRRRHRDLDEYEVDEIDRAAAGLHHDDEDTDGLEEAEAPEAIDGANEVDEDEDEIVEPLTPEAIEAEVLAAFRRHPVLRQRALEIAVDEEGVLELTGWVRRERELRLARRVASRVPGVEEVVVDVAVRDVRRSAAQRAPSPS